MFPPMATSAGDYLPRIADGELEQALDASGAVVVDGVKACGKTSTAERQAASVAHIDEGTPDYELAQISPRTLLNRQAPLLIDEWQNVDILWSLVRRAVDERRVPGQFILTGSATPDDSLQRRRHSGAGRFERLRMRPMSLFESQHSTGEVSLRALFEGELIDGAANDLSLESTIERLVVGGWPGLLGASASRASRWLEAYITTLTEVDMPELGGFRDPTALRVTVAALGQRTAQMASIESIAASSAVDGRSPKWETVERRLAVLERLMVSEDLPAWIPSMRSKSRLTSSAKRHLVDPSLAIAALQGTPDSLLRNLDLVGFLFESMVLRDLRCYLAPLRARMHHWRAGDKEVDIVAVLPDGRWAAFEVKLGGRAISVASAGLQRLGAHIDFDAVGPPVFRAVVTREGVAHQDQSGTLILPVATLGP